jgi:hypothetical protein
MPHCARCGNQAPETASFCPACGHQLSLPPRGESASALPLGEYLKTGWSLFKRYPGGFIGFFWIALLINLVLHLIPIAGGVASFAVSPVLWVGSFIVSAKLLQGHPYRFSDFFLGFRFFIPLLLTALVGGLLTGIGLLLLIIPGVYLLVSYLFASILVVDRRLDFWQALETSRRTVHHHWFGLFGFLLLLALVNLGGFLLLVVGLMVSLPVTSCALTAAYADLLGLQSDYAEGFPDNPAPPSGIAAP